MNERIKELARKAGFYFYDMHDVDGQDLGETIEADSWAAAERFAELILAEGRGGVLAVFEKEYSDEALYDLGRDMHEALQEKFNPLLEQLPKDEFGFREGTFTVKIEWREDES